MNDRNGFGVQVWLVRHGCAGGKEEWHGPDRDRPLDRAGAEQAEALADLLARRRPARLVSSPTRRCEQTLEALARRLSQPVLNNDDLGPDADPAAVLALLMDPGSDGAVLCTHGEVLESLFPLLAAQVAPGAVLSLEDLQKGSVWTVALDEGSERVTSVVHEVPNGVPLDCEAHPTWCA